MVVELRDNGLGAQLVQIVLSGETGHCLIIDGAGHIDADVVAGLSLAIHLVDGGEGSAHTVYLVVDLGLGGLGRRDGDLQAVVSGHPDGRADLHHGVEGHGAGLLPAGEIQFGGADGVDVVFHEGTNIKVRKTVLKGLLTGVLGAHPLLQDAARYLSGAEPRDAHLLGNLLERSRQGSVKLGLVNFYGELDLVALLGLHNRLHSGGNGSCSGAGTAAHWANNGIGWELAQEGARERLECEG